MQPDDKSHSIRTTPKEEILSGKFDGSGMLPSELAHYGLHRLARAYAMRTRN